jgi:polyisoprenoid-binding protein YceI
MRAAILAVLITFCVPVLPSSGALAQPVEQRALDSARSAARFSIQHVFVDRVSGTVPIISGSVTLSEASAIPVRATAVLDATKLNTGDRDRDGSLESPDYFDANSFPTWTFTSTNIVETAPNAFSMDGLLTMHGVTQLEHFEVTVRGDAAHRAYHASARIDRRRWGMKGTRLDPVIGYVADVTLDVVLK